MTSNRRKTIDLASMQFYKFDKWLLMEEGLKSLSPLAKLLYMLIKDREELSLKNAEYFTDSNGDLFQYFDQEKAGELLGVSRKTINKAFKDLVEYGLIESVRQGLGKPNRLYVLDYKVSEATVKELSYKNKKSPTSAKVEDTNNKSNVNNSICNNNNINTSNKENKVENNVSEVEKVIKDSCVNIKKADIKECVDTFTDIDRLKKALSVLEERNSHGIKALRLAYKDIDKASNGNNKVFVAGGNAYSKYSEEELLRMNQRKHQQKIIEHKFV